MNPAERVAPRASGHFSRGEARLSADSGVASVAASSGREARHIHYREFRPRPNRWSFFTRLGIWLYPFDRQIAEFENNFRILVPDRSGYGHSTQVSGENAVGFSPQSGARDISFLEALGIESATLWGHS